MIKTLSRVLLIWLTACGTDTTGSLTDCKDDPRPAVDVPVTFRQVEVDGLFTVDPISDNGSGWGATRLIYGDVDNDGDPEFFFRVSSRDGKDSTFVYRYGAERLAPVQMADASSTLLVGDVDGDGLDDTVSNSSVGWGRERGVPVDSTRTPFDMGDIVARSVMAGSNFIVTVERDCAARKPFKILRVDGHSLVDVTHELPDSPPINVQQFALAHYADKDVIVAAGWACSLNARYTPFIFEKPRGGPWRTVDYGEIDVLWDAPMGAMFDGDHLTVTFDPEIQVFRVSDWSTVAPATRLCHPRPQSATAMIPWGVVRVGEITLIASGADDPYDSGHRGLITGASTIVGLAGGSRVSGETLGYLGSLRGDFRRVHAGLVDGLVVVTSIGDVPAVAKLVPRQ